MQILGIGSALPHHKITQADAAAIVEHLGYSTPRKFFKKTYAHAGVAARHSVVLESEEGPLIERQSFFRPAVVKDDRGPSTAERMQSYEAAAPALAHAAAGAALRQADCSSAEITHLITVSCTGFFSPGVDAELIESLPLPAHVARTHIGFMGCHAALNGLRVARAFTMAEPAATVLMVCVELCTLHHQYRDSPDAIISNALFVDGAAAIVARAGGGTSSELPWRVVGNGSTILPGTANEMTWTIGNHGFEMTLSRRVPELIREHLGPWLRAWLDGYGLSVAQIGSWAIHPGGPAILQAAAAACQLPPGALTVSEEVLAQCGNMSSPTIMFLLERLQAQAAPRPCVALAFGPGLAIEAALLQ